MIVGLLLMRALRIVITIMMMRVHFVDEAQSFEQDVGGGRKPNGNQHQYQG